MARTAFESESLCCALSRARSRDKNTGHNRMSQPWSRKFARLHLLALSLSSSLGPTGLDEFRGSRFYFQMCPLPSDMRSSSSHPPRFQVRLLQMCFQKHKLTLHVTSSINGTLILQIFFYKSEEFNISEVNIFLYIIISKKIFIFCLYFKYEKKVAENCYNIIE